MDIDKNKDDDKDQSSFYKLEKQLADSFSQALSTEEQREDEKETRERIKHVRQDLDELK